MARYFRNLLTAWMCAVFAFGVCGVRAAQLDTIAAANGILPILVGTIAYVCLLLLRKPELERWLLCGIVALCGALYVIFSFQIAFLLAYIILIAFLVNYARFGYDQSPQRCRNESFRAKPIWFLAIPVVLLTSTWTILRIADMIAPTYDFGLFAQMFHKMRTTGLPTTTLERDGLLSHFAVHVSPIFYLMLPFYLLIPSAYTLQLLQIIVMASAIIPLAKLCKAHGLSSAICILFVMNPTFWSGINYDLHENCFLTVLLFWMFYAAEQKKHGLLTICALLTLMVKEDAAVYVAVFGLYWMFQNRKVGASLMLGSVVWFMLATAYLTNFGDGAMNNRYSNMMLNDSLFSMIVCILRCPWRAVYACFLPEKLVYIAVTMLPLFGLPFFTRRYERMILLIPYLLINLLSDYPYQHSIFFQYNFGSLAFLFYLCVLNLADSEPKSFHFWRFFHPILLSTVLFAFTVCYSVQFHISSFFNTREQRAQYHAILELIPSDASVAATNHLTLPLYERDILYGVEYTERFDEVEYVVLEKNMGNDSDFNSNWESIAALEAYLIEQNFQCISENDFAILYRAQ